MLGRSLVLGVEPHFEMREPRSRVAFGVSNADLGSDWLPNATPFAIAQQQLFGFPLLLLPPTPCPAPSRSAEGHS